jgi:HD-GYP domain-containing protein (c-di-GMP phosphodiesterase class II)
MAEQWAIALQERPGGRAGGIAPVERVPVQLRPARRVELLAYLSGAFDLAEGQAPGHAARVAHIALALAQRLRLDAQAQHQVLYTALLHDAGVPVRELPPGVDPTGGHAAAGAWAAGLFGLDPAISEAIRATHERWDGAGRPLGLSDVAIPEAALVVSAAHWATDLLGPIDHPLRARAILAAAPAAAIEPLVGPRVARALHAELRSDAVWMAVWDDQLPAQIAARARQEGKPTLQAVERVAQAMGRIVDGATREPGRSERVARLATALGAQLGLSREHLRALRIAGLLLDVGQLGVPRHITEKPAILSLEEMEVMRRHPSWGARLVELVPGFEEIASWIEAHHERPDGRGYPELLAGPEQPFAARILAVADAYCALLSERPHRAALTRPAALALIEDGAGTQFDAAAVGALEAALAAVEDLAATA